MAMTSGQLQSAFLPTRDLTQAPALRFRQFNRTVSAAPRLCRAVLSTPPLESKTQQKHNEEGDGRVFNFAAGPATLPASVLKQAQEELYNWRGCGMSIMEMSHRGKEFLSVIQTAEASLRSLLNIPDNYAVLFLQGGASTQFSAVPLNLCKPSDTADYIVTGSWSDKAFKEGHKYCTAKVAWSGKSAKYTSLPHPESFFMVDPFKGEGVTRALKGRVAATQTHK